MGVLELRDAGPRDRVQSLAGRVRDQMQADAVLVRAHRFCLGDCPVGAFARAIAACAAARRAIGTRNGEQDT